AENNYDDHGSGFDGVEEHFGRVERPLDEGVGEHHFSTHFAEDSRSQIHDDPIAVHQFREQVARKYNERDAKGESKNDQPVIAAGGSGDRQNIVGGHRDIRDDDKPDGFPEALGNRSFQFSGTRVGKNSDRDPNNERSAHQLDEFDIEELRGDNRERDPQNNGRARAERDSDAALPGR